MVEVRWDLEGLCSDSDRAAADLAEAERLARQFDATYRGRVRELAAAELAEALGRLEAIQVLVERTSAYAYLRVAASATDPQASAFSERCDEGVAAVREHLLFFDLDWIALDDAEATTRLAAPELAGYRHHLSALRRFRPHVLTEAEERVLNQKSLTSREAWCRLHDESCSTISVASPDGEASLYAAIQHLDSLDAEERRRWARATSDALRADLRARGHALRAVVADKAIDDGLRGYPSWLASRNLVNEIPDAVVEAALTAVEARSDIPHRLYALKKRLLDLPVLHEWDRLARFGETSGGWTWDAARELVLEAYGAVGQELRDAAEAFFTNRWIDATPGPGRQRLAFAYPISPRDHPFVFVNFHGTGRDVLTLAHELGHGVHALLASEQTPLNYAVSTVLAESASLFGEMLTMERLSQREPDAEARLDMAVDRVDDAARTIFAPVAGVRFEAALHTRHRAGETLSDEEIGGLWLEANRAVLGPAVEVSTDFAVWWSYVRHFVVAPGYVYAYALGNLLGLALVARARKEGPAFVPRYLRLLRAGGSRPPADLLAEVGIDVADQSIWMDGLEVVDRTLRDAEQVVEMAPCSR